MPTLKHLASGDVITVAVQPQWVDGIWECGDQRITDIGGIHYLPGQPDRAPMSPMTFYFAFTPLERMAIKASSDPMVNEIWATYDLCVRLDRLIDPNLSSVKDAIAYLARPTTANPPGPGILSSDTRINQVLDGTPQ